MFCKKKYINKNPYSELLDITNEQKVYNELYAMSENSEYKNYLEWADHILEQWNEKKNLKNFICFKHYLILLKNNSEALNDILFDIISFVFGGALAGSIIHSNSFGELVSVLLIVIAIEISLIVIRYRNKRELSYYGDLIDMVEYKINQIEKQKNSS